MIAMILFCFYVLSILFVDRLDILATAVKERKRGASDTLAEATGGWYGLLWRILSIVLFALYHLLWAHSRHLH